MDLLERLAGVGTTSLCDAAPEAVVLTRLRCLSAQARCVGRALTVDSGGDLVPVLRGLAALTPGDVLVIATGGATRAVAGELFTAEAVRRGAAGLIVDGLVRDVGSLVDAPLAIWARGTSPRAGGATTAGAVGGVVRCAGAAVATGDIVVADEDGVVVLSEAAAAAAIDRAEVITAGERRILAAIDAGASLFDLSNAAAHLRAVAEGADSRLELRPPAG